MDETSAPKHIATVAYQKKDMWIDQFSSFIEDFEYYPQHCGSPYSRSVLFGKGHRKDLADNTIPLNSARYVPNGECGNNNANVQYFNNFGYFFAETGNGVVQKTAPNTLLTINNPPQGSIRVTSSPSGAKIFLNGVDTGFITPHTFTKQNVGTYTVFVTLSGYVTPATQSKSVVQNQETLFHFVLTTPALPVADFTGTPVTGAVPLGVAFTDRSTGTSITNRQWDFGDGNISNYGVSTNPFHRYTSAGTYSVTLTVTNASGSNSRVRSNYITVTGNTANNLATKVGVFKNGAWYLDNDGSGAWNTGDRATAFGAPGWTSVLGDWNGDGTSEIGIYKDGTWYLDYNGNGVWDTGIDKVDIFGTAGWTPVIGNWNGAATGTKIGIYQNGAWYLDMDGSGTWNTGDQASSFGAVGWTPVVGNWNGAATGDKIGIYQNGAWYLDMDGSGTWNTGDRASSFGAVGWTPVVGNWNGAAKGDKIGIFRDGAWYLDNDGSGTWNAGDRATAFGTLGWTPVLGNWNGDTTGTKIGIYKDGTWYLDYNGNGVWDTGTDKVNIFGTLGWTPIVGKWS